MLSIAALLLAQVLIGPERQLTAPDLRPAAFSQHDAVVASDGAGWLAAWASGTSQYAGSYIAAARMASDGTLIDRTPLVIDSDVNVAHPAMAFGAGRYLVAWSTNDSIRARIVNSDGTMSPTVQVAAFNNGGLGVNVVRAAWDGAHFIVVWPQGFAILDSEARATATAGIPVSLYDFALAGGKGEFVVFDSVVDFTGTPTGNGYPSSMRAFRIDDRGTVSAPIAVAAASAPVFAPRAAFNGSEFLVVWSTNVGLPGEARAARFANGTVTPLDPFYIGIEHVETLTWTGKDYVVTLGDQNRVDAMFLSSKSTMTAGAGNATDAAWNGQRLLIAVNNSDDIYAHFLDDGEQPISLSPAHQESPDVAPRIVVWLESGNVFANGVLLGKASGPPTIATSGSEYLVVWNSAPAGLVARRLDLNGAPLDAQPFTISFSAQRADVAFDGQNFVVAYAAAICRPFPTSKPAVVRVSTAGVVLDTTPIFLDAFTCTSSVGIASGSAGSLAVWPSINGIVASLVDRSGAATTPIRLPQLTGYNIRALWTGSQFIVADVTNAGVEWVTVSDQGIPHLRGFSAQPISQVASSSAFARVGDEGIFAWTAGKLFALRFSLEGFAIGDPFVIPTGHFDVSSVALTDGTLAYQRTVDYPTIPWLTRIFTRDLTVAPAPPRSRVVK